MARSVESLLKKPFGPALFGSEMALAHRLVMMATNVRVPQPAVTEEVRSSEEPSAAEIWTAVDQILKSRTMNRCAKLVRLLTFVVQAKLKGEADGLKETIIGVHVFGRQPDYDPKVDTIVRSQAWRLRTKLLKYYAAEGVSDPLIVSVPKGHYIPVFRNRHVISD